MKYTCDPQHGKDGDSGSTAQAESPRSCWQGWRGSPETSNPSLEPSSRGKGKATLQVQGTDPYNSQTQGGRAVLDKGDAIGGRYPKHSVEL